MTYRISILLIVLFTSHLTALAQAPNGEFLEVQGSNSAVILAHGRGQGPDGQVVGALRRAITSDARLHTLSLQLPLLATSDYLVYAATYPEVFRTLQTAIDYLVTEKKVKRIYVLGYSLGARMTTAFLAREKQPTVIGYIGVGVLQGGGELLDANLNIRKLTIPVLDLYADATPLDLLSAENRKNWIGNQYKQVLIRGANHSFRGYETALSESVSRWLEEQERK